MACLLPVVAAVVLSVPPSGPAVVGLDHIPVAVADLPPTMTHGLWLELREDAPPAKKAAR